MRVGRRFGADGILDVLGSSTRQVIQHFNTPAKLRLLMNQMGLAVVGIIWVGLVLVLRRRYGNRETAQRYDLDVLAGGVLVALTLGFFWRTVSGDVYQPADGGDLVSFLFPTYRFAASQLAAGELPLWNPTLYGGAPFVADIQAGFLYPPNLFLFLVWPEFPYSALQWLSIGHIFWAGLGMYALLRVMRWPWRASSSGEAVMRPAAMFGAVAFQFSDPLLIHFGNLNLIAVLSWLPWAFAAYVIALDKRRPGWAAGTGALIAVGAYAGHAQSTLYVGLAITVYTVLRAAVDERWQAPGQDGRAKVRAMATAYALPLLLAGVVALILLAPVLLPAIQLTDYTERSEFSYQDTVAYSLAPTQLVGLVTPGFFGRGPALHWSLWERVELPYTGVPALLLAATGLLLAPAPTRRRLWPWVGLGAFGLAMGLGVYAILHGWLTAVLPMFDSFRAPARAVVLWTFSVGVVGAVGVDVAARQGLAAADGAARPRALLAGLRAGALILAGVALPLLYLALLLTQDSETMFLRTSVAALAVVLATSSWLLTWAVLAGRAANWWVGSTFAALLVILLFFDLAATGAYTDVSEQDPTAGFRHDEILAFLRAEPGLFRIDTMTGIEAHWQPDTAALAGLQDVGGIANPLSLRHWQDLLAATGGRGTPQYDLLNVGYVIVEDGTPLPEGEFELALDAEGPLSVYRNIDALPRAWVVHEAQTSPDLVTSAQAIQSADFDPGRIAVVVGDDVPPVSGESGSDAVRVTAYGANRLALDVGTSGDGLLVVSEVWYPGWRTRVNGVETPVLAVNGGLRGVPVPAGASTVEMWFAPRAWQIGLGLAAVGLVLLIVWAIAGILRREWHAG